jgi:hypothetical protein
VREVFDGRLARGGVGELVSPLEACTKKEAEVFVSTHEEKGRRRRGSEPLRSAGNEVVFHLGQRRCVRWNESFRGEPQRELSM